MKIIGEVQLGVIEEQLRLGRSMIEACGEAGLDANSETLITLQNSYYDRLTDAKFGEGHAERQRKLCEQMKGG